MMKLKLEILCLFLSLVSIADVATAEPRPGHDEYMRYCSACHGASADGQGPVANVLQPRPPALTNLRPRYGIPLGTKLVAFVMGTTMPRAHGTSDMPVWGENLAEADGDDENAVLTIWRVVGYLQSIQEEPIPEES